MRTTLTIDDTVSRSLLKVTKEKTLAAAVTKAVKDYLRRQELLGVISLAGKIKFEEGYDYKALRGRDTH